MASPTIPFSNPGGNNQTNPGSGAGMLPKTPVPYSSGADASGSSSTNPYFNPGTGAPIGTATPQTSGSSLPGSPAPTATGNTNVGGSLQNPSYTYSTSTNNPAEGSSIYNQLVSIYGQGVGGELAYIMENMGGEDSAMFQQYLASMAPAQASEVAGLQGSLAGAGVGGNSSVSAIANSNLQGQFNANAANADLGIMETGLQDTIGILTGTESDAAKETASSGWNVFGQVAGAVGSLASTAMTGGLASMLFNQGGGGSSSSPSATGSLLSGEGSSDLSTTSVDTGDMLSTDLTDMADMGDFENTGQVAAGIFD
jgi:hypothetical protein